VLGKLAEHVHQTFSTKVACLTRPSNVVWDGTNGVAVNGDGR